MPKLVRLCKTTIKKILSFFGFKISLVHPAGCRFRPHHYNHIDFFEDIKARGFKPQLLCDVGAHVGAWAESISKVYPEMKFILCEPLPEMKALLNSCIDPKLIEKIVPKIISDSVDKKTLIRAAQSDSSAVGGENLMRQTQAILTLHQRL